MINSLFIYSLGFLEWYDVFKVNIKRLITQMNFFKKEGVISQMSNAQIMSIKASRIYAVLLTISVLLIVVFKGLDQITVFETISSPSLATFDRLQAMYPNTLSCSCQQIAVPFRSFVSTDVTIHQVSNSTILYQLHLFHSRRA